MIAEELLTQTASSSQFKSRIKNRFAFLRQREKSFSKAVRQLWDLSKVNSHLKERIHVWGLPVTGPTATSTAAGVLLHGRTKAETKQTI